MAHDLGALIHRGDLAGLVRAVDAAANRRDWDELLWLRDRCLRAAEETGKQLWGAAQYAEYRVALDAPGPIAASVVVPGGARFALGPLTEVVAQHHAWEEVADHLTSGIAAATVAQERVLRGEELRGDPRAAPDELELPLRLEAWEPAYPLPRYRDDEVLEGGPEPIAHGEPLGSTPPGRPAPRPDVEAALRDLTRPWAEQSTGACHVAVVHGDVRSAVAALVQEDAWVRRVPLATVFAHAAWAAASGGAHGRRRGGAAGRGAAWWLAHVVTGLAFPADPDELEFELEELEWSVFGSAGDRPGWMLRLAVGHPDGWAAAIDATDRDATDRDATDHDATDHDATDHDGTRTGETDGAAIRDRPGVGDDPARGDPVHGGSDPIVAASTDGGVTPRPDGPVGGAQDGAVAPHAWEPR